MIGLLMLFPLSAQFMGKETQSVVMENGTISPPFLDHETSKVALLYFGYVGCTAICIPALNELSPLYRKITAKNRDVSFYFVNLNPTQSADWPDAFAKSFHPDFHGIYATLNEVNTLERDFNLAVSENNGEMGHSSNLYLMVRKNHRYVLERIYMTHPYPEKQILHDIQRLMQ
jgi:protein SCO1/2